MAKQTFGGDDDEEVPQEEEKKKLLEEQEEVLRAEFQRLLSESQDKKRR